ncbi:MAG: shikimate dehydrogenase [Lentimicrobium sp.]|jgi:shikimate dehydrogenase|nr:shikimate dehydrogenase [Lentimicrobium sp.]
MKRYGLIGKSLEHSFSQQYFTRKFSTENIAAEYMLFPMGHIEDFLAIVAADQLLFGVNVTFPYKKEIIPFLHALSPIAAQTGAVNTVKIQRQAGKLLLEGYNTDAPAFESEVTEKAGPPSGLALIMGTGGAAAAVGTALQQLGWEFRMVSRHKQCPGTILYSDLSSELLHQTTLIVNATPLGTFPDTGSCPPLPWQWINANHFLFDLVYNPPETLFMKRGKEKGARTINGLDMLHKQAQLSWEIWNSP